MKLVFRPGRAKKGLLHPLLRTNSPLDTEHKITIYRTLIKSLLIYDWNTSAITNRKKPADYPANIKHAPKSGHRIPLQLKTHPCKGQITKSPCSRGVRKATMQLSKPLERQYRKACGIQDTRCKDLYNTERDTNMQNTHIDHRWPLK